jgi:hypothetical protein
MGVEVGALPRRCWLFKVIEQSDGFASRSKHSSSGAVFRGAVEECFVVRSQDIGKLQGIKFDATLVQAIIDTRHDLALFVGGA